MEELLSVLDSSSSRYTFNGIPTKTWLGIVFFQRGPPNSPKMHQLNFLKNQLYFLYNLIFIFTHLIFCGHLLKKIFYNQKKYISLFMNIFAEIFGIIMTISFMFCYIPQIMKIFKNRSSKDVSLGLILMSICGYISGMIYMFLTQFGIWWFANYSVGLIMCIILVYTWFKFNDKGVR